MPRNSSGIYSPPTGTYGISGTPISSSAYDSFINDLSTEITNSVNTTGTAPMLAPLNMGTFKIINAAPPTAATDVATKAYVDAGISPGLIMGYAIDTGPPAGWLSADGSSLSTTTYANLFAIIGYIYGGSGANFNVPDFRGMFLRGFDNGRGSDFQGSRAANAYQASYLINHFHALGDPGHAHGVSDPSHTHGAVTGSHSHSISDPGHAHGSSLVKFVGSGGGAGVSPGPFNTINTNTDAAGTGISIVAVGNLGVTVFGAFTGIGISAAATGVTVGSVSTGNVNFAVTETTVQNYPVLWCIKY
jgi:microcystin-dependent protein